MAIQDQFSVYEATTSQSYAYKCWYNYNYGGNTMQILPDEIGTITSAWQNEIGNWKEFAHSDNNVYDISDDDLNAAKLDGHDNAQEKADFDGKTNVRGEVFDCVLSAAPAASVVAPKLFEKPATKVLTKTGIAESSKEAGKVTTKGAKKATKASDYATVVMAAAVAAKYWINRPNKDEKEACDALQDEMVTAQNSLDATQAEMEDIDAKLNQMADEAEETNEETNDDLKDNQAEYKMYFDGYMKLIDKLERKEPLDDTEKEMLEPLTRALQDLGVESAELQEESNDSVQTLYDDMEVYSTNYDACAENMAQVEGLTDFASGFDSTAKTATYIEAGAQTANAASAGIAAAKLLTKGWWNYAFAAVGFAAAAGSSGAAAQQFSYASDIGNEIDERKVTQQVNELTSGAFDEHIADFEGYMDVVDNLELEVPDELPDSADEAEEANQNLEEQMKTMLDTSNTPQNNMMFNTPTNNTSNTNSNSILFGTNTENNNNNNSINQPSEVVTTQDNTQDKLDKMDKKDVK